MRKGLIYHENGHRYYLDGKRVPGVTTIKGVLDKPALQRWHARVVAEFVADNLDDLPVWARMGRAELVAALAERPNATRDRAAVKGTDVHNLAERVIYGEAVEVPVSLVPYVEGYARFLDEFDAHAILTEQSIGNREHGFAGRFDTILALPRWRGGCTAMVDLKTSNHVYGETALQTGGYLLGEFYTDGNGGPELPIPAVDRIAVAHITAEGTYLYELGDVEAAKAEFLHCVALYKSRPRRDHLIRDPEMPDDPESPE